MVLAIFTLVEHFEKDGKYFGYGPYIREMNLWTSQFKEIIIVAPLSKYKSLDNICLAYEHPNIKFVEVPTFNIKSLKSVIRLVLKVPGIVFKMQSVMQKADHLHFRSPSNVSALAAFVQLFFPSKKKTMRYTGNWNPKSKQPIGYRFQKYIFSNSFFSKNMIALVYGKWANQSNNVRSFFAATFKESETERFFKRDYSSGLNFIFIGTLVEGKRPLLAIQIIKALNDKGYNCTLDIFGNGVLNPSLTIYTEENKLSDIVTLHGNQNKETIKNALKHSHFTILPSKSEGWPKAIAEGMFFGSIPISTKISCLDWMLDYGKRGILIEPDVELAALKIIEVIRNEDLHNIAESAQKWAQHYTVEAQEDEIKKILLL